MERVKPTNEEICANCGLTEKQMRKANEIGLNLHTQNQSQEKNYEPKVCIRNNEFSDLITKPCPCEKFVPSNQSQEKMISSEKVEKVIDEFYNELDKIPIDQIIRDENPNITSGEDIRVLLRQFHMMKLEELKKRLGIL